MVPSIPTYPDSPKGLENLMKDILKLQKKGDAQALAPYLQSLVLPHARDWFESVFGQQIGDSLADSYEREGMEMALSFPDTLADFIKQKVGDPLALEFTDSCNPNATPSEYPILLLRRDSQPLYDVRFVEGRSLHIFSYFAYEGGAFRYLGNFQVRGPSPTVWTAPQPKESETTTSRIRVGGNVMAARLTRQVLPVYPEEAKRARIQGTVLLHAIVAKDGSLRNLQLLQGQCWLAQAAVEAVKQWRYAPYLINGHPVEVDTTIQAIFNME